jgi:hypothetical protein
MKAPIGPSLLRYVPTRIPVKVLCTKGVGTGTFLHKFELSWNDIYL